MNDSGKGLYYMIVLFSTVDDVDEPVVPRMVRGPSYLLFPQKISLQCSYDAFYFLFLKCFAEELSAIHSLLLLTPRPSVLPLTLLTSKVHAQEETEVTDKQLNHAEAAKHR